jgi:hypothetical protein
MTTKNDRDAAARAAYAEDVRRAPFYPDGKPRKAWEELCEIGRESWRRDPRPREYPTPRPDGPRVALFDTERDARAWRAGQGGWLFVRDDGAAAAWFAPGFTPSTVMLHPAVKGWSGTLA